jgi:hypothetical protein
MSPKELVLTVATAIDVPETVMTQHDRRLAEVGFRTTGGRGRSTPDMTFADAGKLIVAGLSLPKGEYSETLSFVRGLWDAKLEKGVMPRALRATFLALSQAMDNPEVTFGDALTALMQDCADGHMDNFIRNSDVQGAPFCLELMPEFWGTASLKFAIGKTETALEFHGHTTGIAAVRVNIYRILAKPLIEIAKKFRT